MSASSIAISGVASRYATALFDLAKDEDQLDEVAGDLNALEGLIGDSADLERLIKNPVVSREAQGQAIRAIAEKAGLGSTTTKFLGVLAQHRRLFALGAVAQSFRSALAQDRGEIKAEVVSAASLSAEELDAVKSAIGRFAGRAVNVEAQVDPSLLGGLVVRVGSRMLDASLKTKLQQLEQSMRGLN